MRYILNSITPLVSESITHRIGANSLVESPDQHADRNESSLEAEQEPQASLLSESAQLSAANTSNAQVDVKSAEQRCRQLENKVTLLEKSIAVLSTNQQQTNDLLAILINSQQAQNVPTAQRNAAPTNPQHSQSNPNINYLPPIPRTSDARGKARPPNDFDGLTEGNAEVWIKEMQTYLELSPVQWVKLASSYLQKDASLWWQSYLNSTSSQNYSTITWSEFVNIFLKRFRSIASEEHAISKLQKWRHNGNLETFVRGFTNLQTSIPYRLMSEGMRVILFTNNLLPHLQRYVKQCKPSTLQDAIAYAREGADTFRSTNNRTVLQPFVNERNVNRQTSQNKRYSLGDTRSLPIQLDNTELDENNYYDENEYDNYNESNSNFSNKDSNVTESFNMLLNALPPDLLKLYKDGRCFNCKLKGHQRNECPKLESTNNKSNNF